MRGRKPKPAAIKRLEGNPGKRPIPDEEPQPLQGFPAPPSDLTPEARAVWDTLEASIKPMGHLNGQADGWALATLCKAIARQLECERRIAETGGTVILVNGILQRNPWELSRERSVLESERLLTRLSLSPVDRARLGLMGLQAAKELNQTNNPLHEFI